MNELKKMAGIVPALVTPLDRSGNVDLESSRNLVNFLIGEGVHGLFVAGSTGECAFLDVDDRKKMVEVVAEEARGRLPLVAHVGAPRLNETLELASHAASIGADAIATVPPYYYAMDDLAMERFFAQVAESVNLPLYLYNIPMNAKNRIDPSLFLRLAKAHSNIVGMKDSGMDFGAFYELIQIKDEGHGAMMGNDAQILPSLVIGGDGAVAAGATALPEPYVKLYKAFVGGNMQEARKWQAVCARVRKMFVKPYPIAPQKKVLEWRGIAGPTVKPPLRQMTNDETAELRRDYDAIEKLLES